jgi:hypothetical protein
VSNIPVFKETTGGNALLADPVNPSAWLDAIRFLENPNRYQLQAHKGLNWVERFRGRSAWVKHISDIEKML